VEAAAQRHQKVLHHAPVSQNAALKVAGPKEDTCTTDTLLMTGCLDLPVRKNGDERG
jgi:hypothetical protein